MHTNHQLRLFRCISSRYCTSWVVYPSRSDIGPQKRNLAPNPDMASGPLPDPDLRSGEASRDLCCCHGCRTYPAQPSMCRRQTAVDPDCHKSMTSASGYCLKWHVCHGSSESCDCYLCVWEPFFLYLVVLE